MPNKSKPKLIVILGPTASGKSDLAVKIALRLSSERMRKKFGTNGAEIVSADSRQVYRGMDIGSGKISQKEMRGVPHRLLDVASPRRTFTAARYQKLGRRALAKIIRAGKIPIVAGGSGFYIDALVYDYALPPVKPDPLLRKKLERKTAGELYNELRELDARRARGIDRNNKRRLMRALEIVKITKKPVPARGEVIARQSQYDLLKIGIRLPPRKLKEKIGRRLDMRLRRGLIAEVRRLHDRGLSWRRLRNFGLEYKFAALHLEGRMDEKTMAEELRREIWRYAKRQMTWWRKDETIKWVKDGGRAIFIAEKFLSK